MHKPQLPQTLELSALPEGALINGFLKVLKHLNSGFGGHVYLVDAILIDSESKDFDSLKSPNMENPELVGLGQNQFDQTQTGPVNRFILKMFAGQW